MKSPQLPLCNLDGCSEMAYLESFCMDHILPRILKNPEKYHLRVVVDNQLFQKDFSVIPVGKIRLCRKHWKVFLQNLWEELDSNLGFIEESND